MQDGQGREGEREGGREGGGGKERERGGKEKGGRNEEFGRPPTADSLCGEFRNEVGDNRSKHSPILPTVLPPKWKSVFIQTSP